MKLAEKNEAGIVNVHLISLSFGFEQESTPAAEEEALPGATSGQNGEPDRQPGAHGERSEDVTDARCEAAAQKAKLTVLLSAYFRFKIWSSPRLRGKSSMG